VLSRDGAVRYSTISDKPDGRVFGKGEDVKEVVWKRERGRECRQVGVNISPKAMAKKSLDTVKTTTVGPGKGRNTSPNKKIRTVKRGRKNLENL
jgi:hypothetical protein